MHGKDSLSSSRGSSPVAVASDCLRPSAPSFVPPSTCERPAPNTYAGIRDASAALHAPPSRRNSLPDNQQRARRQINRMEQGTAPSLQALEPLKQDEPVLCHHLDHWYQSTMAEPSFTIGRRTTSATRQRQRSSRTKLSGTINRECCLNLISSRKQGG